MLVPLFGFLEDDYLGRVIVASSRQTVAQLALQLRAWGDGVPVPADCEVINEAGEVLDPGWTIGTAGLCGGDMFTVRAQ
jgi:hypothetical protein